MLCRYPVLRIFNQNKAAASVTFYYNISMMGYIVDMRRTCQACNKGLSRNDVTFLRGRGVSQKETKSDRKGGGVGQKVTI